MTRTGAKTIPIQVKTVSGKERVYPLEYQAELRALTGTKTLTRSHLKSLANLGLTFELDIDLPHSHIEALAGLGLTFELGIEPWSPRDPEETRYGGHNTHKGGV